MKLYKMLSRIMKTGYAEDEKAREAGFDRFLVKPVNPDELLNLLAELGRPARSRR